MNFSYSLARSWQECQFRTKVDNLEHGARSKPYEYGRLAAWVVPTYTHALQAAQLSGKPVKYPTTPLELEDVYKAVSRAQDAAARWWAYTQETGLFNKQRFVLIDERRFIPVFGKLAAFDTFSIQPDLVTCHEDGHYILYDWKWVSEFRDETDLELDLQSPIYQYGLRDLTTPATEVVWVQGLSDEPTTPQPSKKSGKIRKSLVRCSPEDFRAAVVANGQDPAEYEPVIAQLKPWFRTTRIYRTEAAVKSIWNDVVVPVAAEISDVLAGAAPARRALNWNCHRCWLREECLAGITQGSTIESCNTPWRVNADTATA